MGRRTSGGQADDDHAVPRDVGEVFLLVTNRFQGRGGASREDYGHAIVEYYRRLGEGPDALAGFCAWVEARAASRPGHS